MIDDGEAQEGGNEASGEVVPAAGGLIGKFRETDVIQAEGDERNPWTPNITWKDLDKYRGKDDPNIDNDDPFVPLTIFDTELWKNRGKKTEGNPK